MDTARPQNPALAAALITLATAFIAATTLLAKALGTDTLGPALHPLQISQGRFAFAFIAVAATVAALRPHLRLHAGRTVFGWAGVTLMFAAAARIPLADATAISFLNPVVAMLLAIPFLGERIGPWRWGAAAVALAGVMILLRPTPAAFQPAALLALAAALAMGGEMIFIKKLAGRERPLQVLLVNNALGMMLASAAALAVWQMPTPAQWLALAALGVLMACAQICFINGMARADASFAMPFSYATLVFAALYDFLGFGARPDAITLLGATVILTGAAILAWREGGRRAAAA